MLLIDKTITIAKPLTFKTYQKIRGSDITIHDSSDCYKLLQLVITIYENLLVMKGNKH